MTLTINSQRRTLQVVHDRPVSVDAPRCASWHMSCSAVRVLVRLSIALAALLSIAVLAAAPVLNEPLTGRQVFPVSNWWNADISAAPVDARSAQLIEWISGRSASNRTAVRRLHPDFGPPPYGFPYVVVSGDQPRVPLEFVEYGDDSVAQLGGVHLACEQSSQLLAKALEWGRLAAYLEQSTRYMRYGLGPLRIAPKEGKGWMYAAGVKVVTVRVPGTYPWAPAPNPSQGLVRQYWRLCRQAKAGFAAQLEISYCA